VKGGEKARIPGDGQAGSLQTADLVAIQHSGIGPGEAPSPGWFRGSQVPSASMSRAVSSASSRRMLEARLTSSQRGHIKRAARIWPGRT
jgi:hypothetical protein